MRKYCNVFLSSFTQKKKHTPDFTSTDIEFIVMTSYVLVGNF